MCVSPVTSSTDNWQQTDRVLRCFLLYLSIQLEVALSSTMPCPAPPTRMISAPKRKASRRRRRRELRKKKKKTTVSLAPSGLEHRKRSTVHTHTCTEHYQLAPSALISRSLPHPSTLLASRSPSFLPPTTSRNPIPASLPRKPQNWSTFTWRFARTERHQNQD